jgi:hypothetical protein
MDYNEKDEVGAVHPEYWHIAKKREVYQDVAEGTLKLRAKRKQYLPPFPAETNEDYNFRANTATLFNLTAKTRNMMTGLVFKDPITLSADVSEEIVPLWENIDNAGTHGDVFSQHLFMSSFEGYSAILVDAPAVSVNSREEQLALGLRPYWVQYKADDIWNWQYQINPVSKSKELTMIVLREVTNESTGEFTSGQVVRFRVFRLDNGLVTWALFREERKSKDKVEYILEGEGSMPQLTMIPVAIVGQLGADPFLLDVSLKNLEHFQTYSDYKSLIHKTCVPIPVGKGMQFEEQNVVIGGSTLIQTSADGGFGFSEVEGTSLNVTRQSLQDNRDDIAMMGLSLLADKTARVDITATEALLNNVAETSELRMFARQLQDAIELALGHTAEYLGLPRDAGGSVVLGTTWNASDDNVGVDLDLLNKKADIALKLQGILPLRAILDLLAISNKDETDALLDELRSQDAIILQEETLPPIDETLTPEVE